MKKIFALTLSILMVLGFACSCKPQSTQGVSSQIAQNSEKTDSSTPLSAEKSDNKPSDEVALELFDKTAKRLARAGTDDTEAWAHEDLGAKPVDRKTYDREGNLIEEGWTEDGPMLFYKSNGKYADAEKFYAKIFSGKLLEDFMYTNFTNYDGTLGIAMGGGATGLIYHDLTLTYIDCVDEVYRYTAKYKEYENGKYVETDFEIEMTDDGYRVCKNDYLSGPYGWQRRLYSGRPDIKFATELFNKSIEYIRCFECAETIDAVRGDFGIKFEERTFYDSDGKLLDEYKYPSYYKTTSTYTDAKAHYAKTFTGDMLNNFMDKYFIDMNGYLGVSTGGGATGYSIETEALEYLGYYDSAHNYNVSYQRTEFDGGAIPQKRKFAIVLTNDGYRVCKNEAA